MTSGVQYFPQVIGPNTVVGRLSSTAGITEAIPFSQLAVALGVGGSSYLLATSIVGTNTITGTTATAPLLAANQVVFLIPANTNTGAVTFDRDAQGTPKSVFYNGAALVGGEIAAGVPSAWFYDGTQYNILANGIAAGNAAARGTVASATTTNLDTSSSLYQQITGTTTITGITLANGHVRIVEFAGILTLTNGASLVLPGGANITTAAGDTAVFVGEPSGVVRCVVFAKGAITPNKQPTRTVLTSGTGATYTTPAGATRINVRMVGGGGGGGGGGNNGGTGGTGGATSFGSLTANGGVGGAVATGGVGGTASGGDINVTGGYGHGGIFSENATFSGVGGNGGTAAIFGGAGGGVSGAAGNAGATNSGSGGAGGGSNTSAFVQAGGGGGAGGYTEKLIASPAATYTYTVGATGTAGSAGTNGFGGGAGAAGIIVVDEAYN